MKKLFIYPILALVLLLAPQVLSAQERPAGNIAVTSDERTPDSSGPRS